MEKVVRVT